jgi:Arc/MetJ-type ribon-helix-helix transcriptional regulator
VTRIADRYAADVPQLVIRVNADLVAAIDEMVESGEYASRSDVVWVAVERLSDRFRRDEIGRQIIEGYRRIPETPEEIAHARENARRMVEEEPW